MEKQGKDIWAYYDMSRDRSAKWNSGHVLTFTTAE